MKSRAELMKNEEHIYFKHSNAFMNLKIRQPDTQNTISLGKYRAW